MVQTFDIYNRPEKPSYTLCNPDGTEIHSLIAYERKVTLRYNNASEITFKVYLKTTDINKEVISLDYYDKIRTKRLILIDDIGYFQIQSATEVNDGISTYKDVRAVSVQNEMGFKTMSWFDGTFKFYDILDNSDTIMGKIMSMIPDWSIDTVSSDLFGKYRTFESINTTLLDFILGDVSEAYECIFLFDFLNRTIKVKSVADLMETPDTTNIYLSFRNVLKQFEIEENSDEIVTALSVYGQDLDIRQVNPLGTTYIYNFSHYMTTEWMSQSLIDAITAWQDAIELQLPTYANYLSTLQTKNGELLALETELVDLKVDLASLENIRSARIEQGIDYSDINTQIAIAETNITTKQAAIDAKKAEITAVTGNMTAINTALSFENNFTNEQLLVLKKFIYEQDYTNTYYVVTDLMSAVDIQNSAMELYNEGVNALARMSQPRYTFKIDSTNFMFVKDFSSFTNQLRLGCMVTVELDEDKFAYPILLEMQFNFDDPNDFALVFGNRFRLEDAVYTYNELLSESHTTASRTNANWDKINQFTKRYKDAVSDFLTNAFDVAKNAIINADNQSLLIDSSGATFRKVVNELIDDHQIKIINNQIVFTDDAWDSVKTVIGQIALTGGGTAYGIAAEVLVGRILAGVNLIITNANNSFVIDENGLSFIINDGGTQTTVKIEDYINNEISDLQNLIDGKVTYYWQSTQPHSEYTNVSDSATYNTRIGDVWYDTTNEDTYTYTKSNGATAGKYDYKWVKTTVEIPQELYDTIDGKKSVYIKRPSQFSVNDIWIYEGAYNASTNPTSDLKESTTPGVGFYQAPYVQGTSYTYFEKSDLLIATADSASYSPSKWKKYSTNIDKGNTSFSFVLNDDGVSISNGAINMTTANNTIAINPTDGIKIKKGVADTFYLDTNGNIVMAGQITATSGAIGGWTINDTSLFNGNVGLYSGSSYKYTSNSVANNIRLYAGSSLADSTELLGVPFIVDEAGRLKATSAYISGNLTMASGSKIGDWNVTDMAIYNWKSTLESTIHGIYIGTDGINVGDSTYYFKVTSAGALTATNATITGTINATAGYLSSMYVSDKLYLNTSSSGNYWLSGNDWSYRIYIYNNSFQYFRVTNDGTMECSGAVIEGIVGGSIMYSTGTGYDGNGSAFYMCSGSLESIKGYLCYDTNGVYPDATDRVILRTIYGTALKLESGGNMSISAAAGSKIYVPSPIEFSGQAIFTGGTVGVTATAVFG